MDYPMSRHLSAVTFLALLASPGRCQQAPATPISTGELQKVRDGWKSLSSAEVKNQSYIVTFDGLSFGKTLPSSTARVTRVDDCIIVAKDRSLYSNAPWYTFELKRSKPNSDKWALASLSKLKSYDEAEAPPLGRFQAALRPLTEYGPGRTYTSLLDSPKVHFTELRPAEDGLVVLKYILPPPTTGASEHGQLTLDPAASYCVIRSLKTNTVQIGLTSEEERVLSSKSPPVCASHTFTLKDKGNIQQKLEFKYSEHSGPTETTVAATLSHYGLPEPPDSTAPKRDGSSTYLYLLAAAPVLALLAYALRRYARRAAA